MLTDLRNRDRRLVGRRRSLSPFSRSDLIRHERGYECGAECSARLGLGVIRSHIADTVPATVQPKPERVDKRARFFGGSRIPQAD